MNTIYLGNSRSHTAKRIEPYTVVANSLLECVFLDIDCRERHNMAGTSVPIGQILEKLPSKDKVYPLLQDYDIASSASEIKRFKNLVLTLTITYRTFAIWQFQTCKMNCSKQLFARTQLRRGSFALQSCKLWKTSRAIFQHLQSNGKVILACSH